MSSYAHLSASHADTSAPSHSSTIAPGKRTLTQGLLPTSHSLLSEQRAVVDADEGVGDDYYDPRETVEARVTVDRLTDRQVARARRKNPGWIKRLKVSAQIFSTAEPDSGAFALDVADHQMALGLAVDGIAGPATVRAMAAKVTQARGPKPPTDDERPSDPRFAADDPFGMHLLGAT